MTIAQIQANLSASKKWSEARNLPDPVALADLRGRPDLVMPLVAPDDAPSTLSKFPWPNVGGKVRSLAVVDPIDELTLRVSVGGFVELVDAYLVPRPAVSGYRLGPRPPAWAYRDARRSHAEHRERVDSLINIPSFGGLIVTDVSRCYGSIHPSVARERLEAIGCSEEAVRTALRWWNQWIDRDGCEGLPIGPEWSPTFAHALLGEVDHRLARAGFRHARWSDDLFVGLDTLSKADDVLGLIDEGLAAVGLRRSIEKTVVIDDPREARAKASNAALSGLEVALLVSDPDVDLKVHDLFEAATIGETDLQEFRFAIRTMQNRGDPWAARMFRRHPSLLEIDPTTAGRYLARLAPQHPDDVAPLFCLLDQPPTERTAAVHLHLLKAATSRQWGEAEGRLFETVHDDARTSDPVRWWAAEAIAATPSFDLERCVTGADIEPRQCGARRSALPARRSTNDRLRRACAARVRMTGGYLAATAEFIERRSAPIK